MPGKDQDQKLEEVGHILIMEQVGLIKALYLLSGEARILNHVHNIVVQNFEVSLWQAME